MIEVMQLKKNLRKILNDRDMTAAQLSRSSGVPKTTLGEWLNGGIPRDLRKVKQVADILDMTVDQLCFGPMAKTENSIEEHLDEINAGIFEVVLRRPKRGTS